MDIEAELLDAYWLGVHAGKAEARRGCNVCPLRLEDRQPALISGPDLLLRPAIQN